MTGKRRILIYVGIVALLIIVLVVLDKLNVDNPTQNVMHSFEAYRSVDEIAARLTKDIEDGVVGTDVLYSRDVPIDEILKINYYIGTLDGTIESVSYTSSIAGVTKLDFTIARSDNSYVYRAYAMKEPIPEDKTMAKELYEKVHGFMLLRIKSSMSDYEKEVAIHDYIVQNCKYSYGSDDNENEYRAYGALVEGKAVCNGYAEAMALLLNCCGIENRYITGYAGNELHAWNLVKLEGNWYHVDATWDDPVLEKGDVLLHSYLNLSDDIISKSHSWEKDYFEECNSMAFNYYNMNSLYFEDVSSFKNGIKNTVMRNKHGMVECAIKHGSPSGDELKFLFDYGGIKSFQYSNDGEEDYNILVIYLNK